MRQLSGDGDKRAFLPALIVASMATLFPIAFPIAGFVGVPLAITTPALILLDRRSYGVFAYTLLLCVSILILLLFFQILSNPEIDDLREVIIITIVMSILIPLCASVIHIAQQEPKFIDQLISILYIILILYILLMFLQLIFTDQMIFLLEYFYGRANYPRYKHYFLPIIRVPGFAEEPSHLALAMSLPIFLSILYGHYFSQKKNNHFRKILFLICVLCPSFTLILIITLAILFNFFLNYRKKISYLIFRFLLIFTIPLLAYYIFSVNITTENSENPILIRIVHTRDLFLGRLSVVATEQSSSATFFYKGFELARSSLERYPFGTGINNLHINNHLSTVSRLSPSYSERHSRDGSSFLFKFVGEFGYFAVLLILIVFIMSFRSLLLKKKIKSTEFFLRILPVYCFLCYWIRGMGYFDGLVIFLFSYLLYDIVAKFKSRMNPRL